jgi:organic radical activating enzyme
MNPPKFLFLNVNAECNLHCGHCDFWKSKRDPQAQPLETIETIVGEFASMNSQGKLVICGGEPMLDLPRYMGFCQVGREEGLRVLSVTNGSQITDAQVAELVMSRGPHEISVSFDHHECVMHDLMRGSCGSFDSAKKAVMLLLNAREALKLQHTRVNVMFLLSAFTYRHLEEAVKEFRSWGVDQVKINCIQPSFVASTTDGNDVFFKLASRVDPYCSLFVLRNCPTSPRPLNGEWLAQIWDYFDVLNKATDLHLGWCTSAQTKTVICNTWERNIMVGLRGGLGLCFSGSFRQGQWTGPGSLKAFWEGADDIREKMKTCRRLCGISHSVRRAEATVKPPEGRE